MKILSKCLIPPVGGGLFSEKTEKAAVIAAYVLIAALTAVSCAQSTLLSYTDETLYSLVLDAGLAVRAAMIPLALWFVLKEGMSIGAFLRYLTCGTVMLLLYVFCRSWAFFDLFFAAVFFGKHLEYKKTVRILLFTVFFCSVLTVIFYEADYFAEYHLFRGDKERVHLGFVHPNRLARAVMLLVFLYTLFRDEKLNYADCLIPAAACGMVFVYPNSETGAITLFLYTVVLFIYLLIKKRKPDAVYLPERPAVRMILPHMAGIMFLFMLVLLYTRLFELGSLINENFASRFYTADQMFELRGIRLFGRPFHLISDASVYFGGQVEADADHLRNIDCFYLQLPLVFGVIPALFYFERFRRMIIQTIKDRKTVLLLILMMLLIYMVMENMKDAVCAFPFILAASQKADERNRSSGGRAEQTARFTEE